MINSCSTHGQREDLLALKNIRIEFRFPNTISPVQLLDAGIRAWIKTMHKRRVFDFRKVIHRKGEDQNIDVPIAM